MADKTIIGLDPATTVNYTDDIIIAQGTAQAKLVGVPATGEVMSRALSVRV